MSRLKKWKAPSANLRWESLVRRLRDFLLTIMGKRICYSAMGFTNEKCGLRLSSDCSESSIEDILDSLNDAIDDILRNAMPRVSTLNLLICKCCPVLPLSPCKSTLCFWKGIGENLIHSPFLFYNTKPGLKRRKLALNNQYTYRQLLYFCRQENVCQKKVFLKNFDPSIKWKYYSIIYQNKTLFSLTEVPFQANFVVVYDLFHLRRCGSLCLKLLYLAEIFFKKTFLIAGSKKIVFVFANVLCLRVNLHVSLKM